MEERAGIIYGLSCSCHPEGGTRYVGQTINGAKRRLRGHLSDARISSTRPVCRWIRKHGDENILISVIEVAALSELNSREIHWIAKMRSQGLPILNVTSGGDGVPDLPPEMRAMTGVKIGNALRGRKLPQEVRAKMSLSRMGHSVSAETRAKLAITSARRVRQPADIAKWKATRALSGKGGGEFHPMARLGWAEVDEIRSRPRGNTLAVAAEFGVSVSTIRLIHTGKRWPESSRPREFPVSSL